MRICLKTLTLSSASIHVAKFWCTISSTMTRISPPFLRFSAELCCCFQSLCGQNFEGNTVLHLTLLFCAQSSSSRREESNSKANFHRWFQAQQREGGKAINSNPAIILSAIFYGFFLSLSRFCNEAATFDASVGGIWQEKVGRLIPIEAHKSCNW